MKTKKSIYKNTIIEIEGKEAIILTRSQFETFKEQFTRLQQEVITLKDRLEKLETKYKK